MIRSVVVCLVVVAWTCNVVPAFGGRIQGTTLQLDGKVVPNVNIQTFDVGANRFVPGTLPSNGAGEFDITLPSNAAVSVTFSDPAHDPASLVGISGDVQLQNFRIFLPSIAKAVMQPARPCGCYRRGFLHRRR
jgi:hypothetical protein